MPNLSIQIKRIYEDPAATDGRRILVDRLWPRGLSKDKAKIDYWAKDIAPSTELRQWYGHDPAKWTAFQKKYAAELRANDKYLTELLHQIDNKLVTLLFGSQETTLNNAYALKLYLDNLYDPHDEWINPH